jgi:Tfp pilus assembly protein PilN
MHPILIPAVTGLAGVTIQAIAAVERLVRLRSRERQRRADRASFSELARTLPRGCRLDERRADGSELHLVIAPLSEPGERPST